MSVVTCGVTYLDHRTENAGKRLARAIERERRGCWEGGAS